MRDSNDSNDSRGYVPMARMLDCLSRGTGSIPVIPAKI
jgi:hypothetical protein